MNKWKTKIVALLFMMGVLSASAAAGQQDAQVLADVGRQVAISISDTATQPDPDSPDTLLVWEVTVDELVLYPGESLRISVDTDGVFRHVDDANSQIPFRSQLEPVVLKAGEGGKTYTFSLPLRLNTAGWDRFPAGEYEAFLVFKLEILDESGKVIATLDPDTLARVEKRLTLQKDSISVPKTGDTSMWPAWAALLVSAGVLIGLAGKRRRNESAA